MVAQATELNRRWFSETCFVNYVEWNPQGGQLKKRELVEAGIVEKWLGTVIVSDHGVNIERRTSPDVLTCPAVTVRLSDVMTEDNNDVQIIQHKSKQCK